MKKQRSKIRKFLLRFLLFLLLFVGLLAILLRSRSVQTYLANQAGQYLQKELGCTVSIKSLEFDLVQNIHLEGLYLSDQQGDSMIFLRTLDFRLRKFNQVARKIDFFNGEITGAFIRVGHHKGVKGQNIDFLIDYINGPPKKTKSVQKPWAIHFGKAVVKQSRFHYFDERGKASVPGIIDEKHLEFNGLSGVCKDFWIVDDSLHFEAQNLRLKERSGLQIDEFDAICNIHYKGMDFAKLEVRMPCSELKGELHFAYPGYKYLDEFISNTQWRGHLENSRICLDELSIFDQSLKGHKELLTVSADISGTFDKLKLKRTSIKTCANTVLAGNLYFEGLPDWQTMYCDFDLNALTTTADDLNRLLPLVQMPSITQRMGALQWSGTFKGQLLDFRIDGALNTDIGSLDAHGYLNFEDGFESAQYAGNFNSAGIDAGLLLGAKPDLGLCAFQFELEGEGLTPERFNMKLAGNLPQFELRGKTFADATVKGSLTSRTFDGEAIFADPRLNFSFAGNVDFSAAAPRFNFTATANGTDLSALGLDTAQTLLYTSAEVDLQGLNLTDLVGDVQLRNTSIHRSGRVYSYGYQKISKRNFGKNTAIKASGEAIQGSLSGQVNLANMPRLFTNMLATVFPKRIHPTGFKTNDSFDFALSIPETGLLAGYVAPSLNTTALEMAGSVNGKLGTVRIASQPLDLCWGQLNVKQMAINVRKADSLNMDFVLSADRISHHDSDWFTNIALSGAARHSNVNLELKMRDARWNEEIDLIAQSTVHNDSVAMNLANSKMELMHNEWSVAGNAAVTLLPENRLRISNMYFEGKDAFFEVNGIVSDRSNDTLHVDAGNFSLENLNPLFPGHSLDSLKGKVNASIYLTSALKKPKIWGDFSARDLYYMGVDYGDLDVGLNDNGEPGRLGLTAGFVNGPLDGVSARGSIAYEKYIIGEQFDVKINIPGGTGLKAAQPFLKDIVTIQDGKLSGNFHLGGNAEAPKLSGNANLMNAYFKVDYLNTSYRMSASIIADETGIYTFKPARLVDETGKNSAWAKLSFTHSRFADWKLDLRIDSARNLKCLNTTQKDNDLFYGVGYADGGCRIYGPLNQISMDIKLKTRKNTQIFLMYSDVGETSFGSGFVKFRTKGIQPTSGVSEKKKQSGIYRINILLEATPEAEAQFVIDKKLGDIIRGKGSGTLRMLYDENEHFFLYGNYVVNEGDYVFSLPGINVLTRKIALDKGGSISWDGDPYNALVSMNGSFEKKISPAALMYAVSSSSNKNYPATRIISKLQMKGNLFSPEITFDLQAPDLQSSGGAGSSDVYSVIQRIRTDKDETMRQAVSLLLFGNFIPPSFATNSGAGIISGSGVAGNSLSGIASTVVNDIFTRLGIPTRIQVNIDDVRSASGTNTKVFINSEWFLTERLRLDVNYDPTVAMQVSNVALPLNFNLEYMTRNENWRLKAFSRSNNLLLQQNSSTITNGVSGNTLGGGVVYRREFNTLRSARSAAGK